MVGAFSFLQWDNPLGYLIARKEKKRKEKKRKVIEAPKSFKRGARKGPFSFLNVDIENIYIQEKKSHRGEALFCAASLFLVGPFFR